MIAKDSFDIGEHTYEGREVALDYLTVSPRCYKQLHWYFLCTKSWPRLVCMHQVTSKALLEDQVWGLFLRLLWLTLSRAVFIQI